MDRGWCDTAFLFRIPGAKFAAINDAAHFPMVERPEETARLLREFLESGLSPRA